MHVGIANQQWRGKLSRRMRNPQYYVSGKRPMALILLPRDIAVSSPEQLTQNGHHFADDIFKRISWTEKVPILIKISLKFIPKGPIDKKPPLVQIMAWRRTDARPLSEPMVACLIKHVCVTRPQWVSSHISSFIHQSSKRTGGKSIRYNRVKCLWDIFVTSATHAMLSY